VFLIKRLCQHGVSRTREVFVRRRARGLSRPSDGEICCIGEHKFADSGNLYDPARSDLPANRPCGRISRCSRSMSLMQLRSEPSLIKRESCRLRSNCDDAFLGSRILRTHGCAPERLPDGSRCRRGSPQSRYCGRGGRIPADYVRRAPLPPGQQFRLEQTE
jgi:hypothetical protein